MDQHCLERLCALRFAGRNVVVVRTNGDPKRTLHGLRETLGGDLQKSPLRDRLFVWAHNGIEYVYPPQVMTRVFSCGEIQLSELTVREEAVFLNGIERRKRDLCREVVRSRDASTVLPAELEEKLLTKISQAIG
jgi:hypothetical protein